MATREAYIGFKGRNNSSSILVNALSQQHYLLTNSFVGLKRDIAKLPADYDVVYLFGVDKNLIGSFRIEQCAEKDGTHLVTNLDLKSLAEKLSSNGIKSTISKTPTHYLCNEAYWHLLEKYQGKAVLIHIPTIKNFNNIFGEMTFPEYEYDSVQNYLNRLGYCYTTRVYKEVGKYKADKLYIAPWGDMLKIEEVKEYQKVSDRPFYNEMSDEEKAEIRKYSEDMRLPYEFIKFSRFSLSN